MVKKKTDKIKSDELRKRAEKLFENKNGKPEMSTDDIIKISQELAIHQIELEMQSEELRRAQIEVEKSRDKYVELFDFAPLGHLTLDKNNFIVEVNLAAAQLLDTESSNLIKTKITKFIAPESQDKFYAIYRKDFKPGEKRSCELNLRRKNGTYFPASLEAIARPDEDGHLTKRLIVVTDIEERKRIEDLLFRSEEQFRNIFEKSPIGIALYDGSGVFVTCNQAYLEIFGITTVNNKKGYTFYKDPNLPYNAEDILLRGETIKYESPLDFEKVKQTKLYKTTKSGIIQIDVLISPLFARGRKVSGFLQLVQDITERKKAQDYILQAKNKLETQVKERTAELERSNKELRLLASRLTLAEERERRRIAQEVHDRIGQSMSLCSIQLGRTIHSTRSKALTQRLKEIQNNVKEIINEMRGFIFELSPAVLYDFGLEVALERLTKVLGERHNLIISYKDDGETKYLEEDIRIVLFQMTRELLVNAIRHAKATQINLTTMRFGDMIHIIVQDNGIGFDKKILKNRDSGGLGLFSISERLKQIGGYTGIKSKRETGTTITLVAPIRPELAETVVPPITNNKL